MYCLKCFAVFDAAAVLALYAVKKSDTAANSVTSIRVLVKLLLFMFLLPFCMPVTYRKINHALL
jgi:hypothetical protein